MADARYSRTARILHWISALLIVAALGLGASMVRYFEWDVALKFSLYQAHKTLGISLLAVTAVRLGWRLGHVPPSLTPILTPREARLARANHLALYLLLFAMPLSGWAMVSASTLSIQTLLFGWIPWPHIPPLASLSLETRQLIEPWAKWVHGALALSLCILIVVHVAAALRHGLLRKDGILGRMWFGGGRLLTLSALAALATLGLAGEAAPIHAAQWSIDPAASSLTFETRASGQPVRGGFGSFAAKIDFDPGKPELANVRVEVELDSLTTGQPQLDQVLRGEAWFDMGNHPKAVFLANGGEKLADGRYALQGAVTIRGKTQPLVLRFSLETDKGRAHARAEFTILRSTFGIGRGAIVRQLAVRNEVEVRIDVVASPEP